MLWLEVAGWEKAPRRAGQRKAKNKPSSSKPPGSFFDKVARGYEEMNPGGSKYKQSLCRQPWGPVLHWPDALPTQGHALGSVKSLGSVSECLAGCLYCKTCVELLRLKHPGFWLECRDRCSSWSHFTDCVSWLGHFSTNI